MHAAADGSRGVRGARARGGAGGHPGRPDSSAGRAGRLPRGAAGIPGRARCPGHAAAGGRRLAGRAPARSRAGAAARHPGGRGGRAGRRRPRVAGALPAGGRAPPLGARAGQGRADAAAFAATRRWSSSRCSAPSSGWRPTSARARARWRRRGGAPRPCWPRSRPAWWGSTPRGGSSSRTARRWTCSARACDEGEPFLERLGAGVGAARARWSTRFSGTRRPSPAAELEVGGRRLTLQLAPLGPDVRGVVIALNDVTDLSRAERVLAWGEMARQVAHEIKNPLTPDAPGHAAPAAGVPRPPRRLRPDAGGDRGADAGGDRPAGHHRARVQPLRRSGRRRRSRWTGSTSASWSARWSSSTGWRRKGARCELEASRRPAARPAPTR